EIYIALLVVPLKMALLQSYMDGYIKKFLLLAVPNPFLNLSIFSMLLIRMLHLSQADTSALLNDSFVQSLLPDETIGHLPLLSHMLLAVQKLSVHNVVLLQMDLMLLVHTVQYAHQSNLALLHNPSQTYGL